MPVPSTRLPLPDETLGAAGVTAMAFAEEGPNAGQAGEGSTRVGFTLRDSNNRITDAFAFRINPQGLAYTLGSRASLFAVKSGFYVDDFGPAPSVVVMRQLIASGKSAFIPNVPFYTAREDVQRFLKTIYLPAIAGQGKTKGRVFFHDHHFERGFEQRVVFMPSSCQIGRDVNTPGIWTIELTMLSLEKYPFAEVTSEKTPTGSGNGYYTVKRGDTLRKIATKLAGERRNTPNAVEFLMVRILRLNPQIKRRRKLPNGETGKPMVLYKGEAIALP